MRDIEADDRPRQATGAELTSPSEVHRRLVAMYPEMLATGRLDEGLALIAPDVVDHRGGADGDHVGRDAWREKWERAMTESIPGFHDVSVTVEQNVAAGDTSVNRYTTSGTHTASGRRFEVLSMDMVRVQDGQVVEHWAVRDTDAIRHQLGSDSDLAPDSDRDLAPGADRALDSDLAPYSDRDLAPGADRALDSDLAPYSDRDRDV